MSQADLARVIETARRAAAAAQHAFVGTEHLLAAALADPDAASARALAAAGVSLDGLAEELLTGLPRAEPGATSPPPLSRFAERAVADAEKADGNLVAVLLRAPKGRIASVLAKRGAKTAELRRTLESPQANKPAKAARPDAVAAELSKTPRRGKQPPPETPGSPRTERRLPPHLDSRRRGAGAPRRVPWSLVLLLAIPASVILSWQDAPPLFVFVLACLGVLPLAGLMGEATEQLAERTSPTIGALLNATFGNAAELIIALVALRAGLVELVKASITGSILGNLLLILGLSIVAGGLKAPLLKFNRTSAGMAAAMLALAVAGLVFPALFHSLHPGGGADGTGPGELGLSQSVALILAVTYGLSLLFSLRTHRAIFSAEPGELNEGKSWGVLSSIAVLGLATLGVVVESELLVHSIEPVTHTLGLSQTFLGLIVIPLIGNAAEHATAIAVARKGKTDLSLQIALGSSTQVALLIAPLLVLAGGLMGQPMSLLFTSLEVVALGIATVVVAIITLDGESHWFEGVQLLALYAMIGAAAYFL